MPNYEIEMLWDCRGCPKKGNRGMARHCAACGRPKSELSLEYFPDDISEKNALHGDTGSKERDWSCKYCGYLQPDDGACCTECGCDKGTGRREWKMDAAATTEHADGSGRRKTSSERIEGLPKREDSAPTVSRSIPTVTPTKRLGMVAAIVAIAAIVIGAWLLFRTIELNSGVRSVAWTHTVSVERNRLVREEGWSVPTGAEEAQNLGLRFHYLDHRMVGSHQEAYDDPQPCGRICGPKPPCYKTDRTCTKQGNGKASCSGGDLVCPSADCSRTRYCARTSYRTVNDYRDFSIDDPCYSWMEWRWRFERKLERSGTTTETTWPTPAEIGLNANVRPRETERSSTEESYKVVLGHHGKLWDLEPKSDIEFRLYPTGSRHEIKVNALGQVEVVRHGR